MSKWLVAMALPEESGGLLEKAGARVLYTGLGKVNAAYALTSAIYRHRAQHATPLRILNLGTAGSHTFAASSLVECSQFIQHDMDVSPLGFALGTTPFENDLPPVLTKLPFFSSLPKGTCHSGDRFIAAKTTPPMEVIDMEAYAYAKVCQREQVDFACIKFISDGADGQAASDWPKTLQQASEALTDFYLRHALAAAA